MTAPAGSPARHRDQDSPQHPSPHSPPRRFWSVRRVPAALTALVILAVACLFLYDLAAVRAHRPGMRWRQELARQLDRQTPADTAVLIAGGVLALAGLVLLVLAIAPGLRGILMMRAPEGAGAGVRAGLGRKAAALVLRDRAMEVSGVRSARVKAGRRRVKVRATSHFRELEDVRTDLDGVLAVAVEELGLARPLPARVRVRRGKE
ncbi:DUF6286 domain-containing protein [Streptomyces sp. MJM1172]|uniref:DUF6286 domain-containing protein n=1 Tax=Streptomyces sp. MJM1172 TaxID=1703926 RepID=UPI00093E43E6|nr:DUF6286 domain-containing protein [Streptomyces sp. MJM1172]OKI49941.1 hypothetical protein AMK15_33060 [Streptomyces sp. MJM1172]